MHYTIKEEKLLNAQFKRGIVELCIIKILSTKEMSTYEVLGIISKDLDVNENTVYPIIRRLTNEGILDVKKMVNGIGAPKKYYILTPKGFEKLESQEDEWNNFLSKVAKIMEGNYE